MFHHEFWKSVYFGSKRSKVKVMINKNSDGMGFALFWVLASSSYNCHGTKWVINT